MEKALNLLVKNGLIFDFILSLLLLFSRFYITFNIHVTYHFMSRWVFFGQRKPVHTVGQGSVL